MSLFSRKYKKKKKMIIIFNVLKIENYYFQYNNMWISQNKQLYFLLDKSKDIYYNWSI